jgi:hypothetical protein
MEGEPSHLKSPPASGTPTELHDFWESADPLSALFNAHAIDHVDRETGEYANDRRQPTLWPLRPTICEIGASNGTANTDPNRDLLGVLWAQEMSERVHCVWPTLAGTHQGDLFLSDRLVPDKVGDDLGVLFNAARVKNWDGNDLKSCLLERHSHFPEIALGFRPRLIKESRDQSNFVTTGGGMEVQSALFDEFVLLEKSSFNSWMPLDLEIGKYQSAKVDRGAIGDRFHLPVRDGLSFRLPKDRVNQGVEMRVRLLSRKVVL